MQKNLSLKHELSLYFFLTLISAVYQLLTHSNIIAINNIPHNSFMSILYYLVIIQKLC